MGNFRNPDIPARDFMTAKNTGVRYLLCSCSVFEAAILLRAQYQDGRQTTGQTDLRRDHVPLKCKTVFINVP